MNFVTRENDGKSVTYLEWREKAGICLCWKRGGETIKLTLKNSDRDEKKKVCNNRVRFRIKNVFLSSLNSYSGFHHRGNTVSFLSNFLILIRSLNYLQIKSSKSFELFLINSWNSATAGRKSKISENVRKKSGMSTNVREMSRISRKIVMLEKILESLTSGKNFLSRKIAGKMYECLKLPGNKCGILKYFRGKSRISGKISKCQDNFFGS